MSSIKMIKRSYYGEKDDGESPCKCCPDSKERGHAYYTLFHKYEEGKPEEMVSVNLDREIMDLVRDEPDGAVVEVVVKAGIRNRMPGHVRFVRSHTYELLREEESDIQ